MFQSPSDKAQNWKNKGNKYFKGGNYAKAIECYTEAMSVCPPENKETLATFYQNRAAAHEKLVQKSLYSAPAINLPLTPLWNDFKNWGGEGGLLFSKEVQSIK